MSSTRVSKIIHGQQTGQTLDKDQPASSQNYALTTPVDQAIQDAGEAFVKAL